MSNLLNVVLASLMLVSTSVSCDTNISLTYNYDIQEDENSLFYRLGGYPSPAKDLDCDDGYIVYNLEVFKCNYTSTSNLYIVHTASSFVPGHVARLNGNTNYKDYSLKHGYVHLTIERANKDGIIGGEISPKAMWPLSSDFTTTISSSFGSNLIFSKEQGSEITLGEGGELKTYGNNSTALQFSFVKSKSTTSTDPVLSAQYSSDNICEAQWSFEILKADIAGNCTYSFDQYFMFEMKTNSNGISNDAFNIIYSVDFCGQFYLLWKWREGYDFYRNTNISCFY